MASEFSDGLLLTATASVS